MGSLTKDFDLRRRGERRVVLERQSYGTNATQTWEEVLEARRKAITVPPFRMADPFGASGPSIPARLMTEQAIGGLRERTS